MKPRVFSIPSGSPFLDVLAEAILSRSLVAFGDGPLDLAGVTVLLPTRRAARAFADTLARHLGGTAAILPMIRTIGDVDEEEHLLSVAAQEANADRITLPLSLEPLTRRLKLTNLTLEWARDVRRHPLRLDTGEPLRIPGTAADAAALAADLGRLLDDLDTAGISFDRIEKLAPDEHADHYRLTLDFLAILSERWPQYLAGVGRVDPSARRDSLIRDVAARIATGPTGPIVAAGSTGSVPATAALLKAIAGLPNGAVVLPGLDTALDAETWAAIGGSSGGDPSGFAHPQFGMKQLVAAIGIDRSAVASLGETNAVPARAALLSEAMRPATTAQAWAGFEASPGALAGVAWIAARNEQEEATAIALAIREAVEAPDVTVAVVTPDRTIARRVSVELGRWGLDVDDSAGARLDREPPGVFARLFVEAIASDADPVALLALLKHPLAAFGMEREMCRRAARRLELALFRGRRVTGGVAGLPGALAAARISAGNGDRDIPLARRRLSRYDWDIAGTLVQRLVNAIAPVSALFATSGASPLAAIAARLSGALSAAASDDSGGDAAIGAGRGGEALARLLDGLAADPEAAALDVTPQDLPRLLDTLMADVTVTRAAGTDPRIHIWGALEARLQTPGLVILAGLDEGIWPAATRTDPWLSRAMRAEIGLPPPERRIGLAAHDFVQAMSAPRVAVTRADKRGGAPTVESRWLQRLRALAGPDEIKAAEGRGAAYLALARALDVVPDRETPARPQPKPPVAARPTTLSITEIETLIRDPYAIYARRILKLEPLEPLGREPDAALRGTLIHKALGDFTNRWTGAFDAAAEQALFAEGASVLERIREYPDTWSIWSIRFAAIARWYVGWEAARAAAVRERNAEVSGTLVVPLSDGAFTLRGRADRIDRMADGTVAIYDFKTGAPQTDRTVFAGLTPQMTLEAAMVRAGGFDAELAKIGRAPLAGLSVSDLAWLSVGKAGRDDVYKSAVLRGETADALADKAHAMFAELVAAFARPEHPYASRTRPMMERARYLGDYDHLARVREWALIESIPEVMG